MGEKIEPRIFCFNDVTGVAMQVATYALNSTQ
jgi:hypothetical protein